MDVIAAQCERRFLVVSKAFQEVGIEMVLGATQIKIPLHYVLVHPVTRSDAWKCCTMTHSQPTDLSRV